MWSDNAVRMVQWNRDQCNAKDGGCLYRGERELCFRGILYGQTGMGMFVEECYVEIWNVNSRSRGTPMMMGRLK